MSRSNTDAYGRQEDNLVEITLLDGNVCYPGGKKVASLVLVFCDHLASQASLVSNALI